MSRTEGSTQGAGVYRMFRRDYYVVLHMISTTDHNFPLDRLTDVYHNPPHEPTKDHETEIRKRNLPAKAAEGVVAGVEGKSGAGRSGDGGLCALDPAQALREGVTGEI